MNQVLEEYLHHFTSYFQDDWYYWLPLTQITINSRNAASTGVSPFFLSHGYDPHLSNSIDLEPLAPTTRQHNPRELGDTITQKLQQVIKLAQTIMAAA